MMPTFISSTKRLLFFWLISFLLAVGTYYFLWAVMPRHMVFGGFFRMRSYHVQHPILYISIPCFFFGIIATSFAQLFHKLQPFYQALLTIGIVALTVFVSSPIGGMLYYYHDMQAGYFPQNWFNKLFKNGIGDGLGIGWFVVLTSIPYNIIGTVAAFFLMRIGSNLFRGGKNTLQAEGGLE